MAVGYGSNLAAGGTRLAVVRYTRSRSVTVAADDASHDAEPLLRDDALGSSPGGFLASAAPEARPELAPAFDRPALLEVRHRTSAKRASA